MATAPARPARAGRRGRRLVSAAVAGVAVGAGVLLPASPGAAGGAQSQTYLGTWSFDGHVVGSLGRASSTRLVDYAGTKYYDRVLAEPESPETVTLTVPLDSGPVPIRCRYGTAYQSGINLYGEHTDWANIPVHGTIGGRMQVACYYPDGSHHRFHWGAFRESTGQWGPSSNCLVITRTSLTTYDVRTPADAPCPAQDEVVEAKPSKQLSSTLRTMPFSATVTLESGPPITR